MADISLVFPRIHMEADVIAFKKEFFDNVEKNWKECPGLDREFESKCIYKDGDSPDEVFSHLDKIQKNEKTKFLFNTNITGYRR